MALFCVNHRNEQEKMEGGHLSVTVGQLKIKGKKEKKKISWGNR